MNHITPLAIGFCGQKTKIWSQHPSSSDVGTKKQKYETITPDSPNPSAQNIEWYANLGVQSSSNPKNPKNTNNQIIQIFGILNSPLSKSLISFSNGLDVWNWGSLDLLTFGLLDLWVNGFLDPNKTKPYWPRWSFGLMVFGAFVGLFTAIKQNPTSQTSEPPRIITKMQ